MHMNWDWDPFLHMMFDEGDVVKFERDPDIIEVTPVSYSSERRDAHVDGTDTGLERDRGGDVAVG